ncbi:MAG: Fic family protein [Candidatus Eisenbacteria bacterium]|nr:Fic family protein [Candidatus Eisenbacteria bacterium]
MIFKAPTVSPGERRIHDQVDALRQNLGYATQARVWTGALRRVMLARAVQGSNSIEGILATMDDVLAVDDGEPAMEASDEIVLAIAGYRDAMTYVLQLADDPFFTISPELIRSLHFMMMKHELTRYTGRWRPGPGLVVDERSGDVVYEGPSSDVVPGLMSELVGTIQTDDSPVMIRAAMAHLNLAMIHPFKGGNGRMARVLQTLILAREGILAPQFCSIEEYLGRNTADYYRALALAGQGKWNPERDARVWIRFCLTAHYRQAVTLLRRTRELNRLWDRLAEECQKRRLPDRMIPALADAAMGYRVRTTGYRAQSDLTQNSASRDLTALARAGLLEAHGEKRGRFYVGSTRLVELRKALREARVTIRDPFADPNVDQETLPGLDLPGVA